MGHSNAGEHANSGAHAAYTILIGAAATARDSSSHVTLLVNVAGSATFRARQDAG